MRRNTFKPDLLTAVRKTVNPNAEYGRSICCPFHRETDPSLHIFENQSWYCFGCGKGGDVFDFLGFLKYGDSWDSRNKEMFREIKKSVDNSEFIKVYVDYNAQTQMPEISEETKEAFLLAAQTYHQALISGMENGADTARSYLYSRGITDKTIRKLKIGYAGRSELHKKGITLRPDMRTKRGYRDMLMLAMMYDTAARVTEVTEIRIGDIRTTSPSTVVLHGKGSKDRIVPLSSKTANLVQAYIEQAGLDNPSFYDKYLFVNRSGEKLTRAGVAYILRKYVTAAHKEFPALIPDLFSPHCMRHSKAMHLLQAGVEIL